MEEAPAALPIGPDLVDVAREQEEEMVWLAVLDRSYDLQVQVDEAMGRLARGEYGLCMDCGAPIGMQRLRVLPFALRCLRCQERSEMTTDRGLRHFGFLAELGERLAKFGLRMSPAKTRRLPFPRTGEGAEAFDFLGFEFRWHRDRQGRPHLTRRTPRKSLRASLQRYTDWRRTNRHRRMRDLFRELNQKLGGY
jgi:RNA polymerase-binding protein DksA